MGVDLLTAAGQRRSAGGTPALPAGAASAAQSGAAAGPSRAGAASAASTSPIGATRQQNGAGPSRPADPTGVRSVGSASVTRQADTGTDRVPSLRPTPTAYKAMRKRSSARFAGPGTGTMVGGVGGEAARDAVAELLAEQAPAGSKPSLKEVCMALGQCWKSCAMDAFATAKAIIGGLTDKSRPVNVSLGGLLGLLFWCGVFASTLLMAFLRPSALSTLLMAVFVGLLIGLGLSFAYYANLAEKEEIRQVMATNIGLKGLASLLGHLPSWLAFSENEKMEWMNTILIELWPFVDAAVCKMVREMVEQVFADTIKSTGVPLKSITFNRLTFGDAPFRVEGIQVDTFDPDVLDMRLQVRWSGDANITLAIAVLNEATTLCPQVSDISFFGSLRVRAAPMTDKIPGFGAIMVTLERPPRFKYYLNFGTALGGAFIASVIKPFINSTIHNVLLNEMVWPQRIVAPVVFGEVDERTALAIARLGYYHQGLMKVELISGEDLPSEDLIGRNDPYVEFSTDGKYKAKSKVLRKSKHPKWNETLYLLVQEPDNQDMHAQAQQIASLVDVVSLLCGARAAPAAEAAQPARPAAAAAPVASAGGGLATERPASGATRAASARGPSRRGGLPARVGDTSLRRSFVLSIPVARGANWFLAGGGRRMDEEEATAAAERIAAAAEDGTSLPVRLAATDVVRFLYGGTGRREPADGGVVSASLLNAKPAVGGIGVEPRGGGVLRVLFTVASDAVADTVVRWRHELRRCVDSTAAFDVLSDREEAQHQALWPAFLAAKVAGKRAQFHRARLVVDGERVTCYDYDVMSAADVIGRCSIPVISVTTLEHNEPPHNALDWKYHLGTSLFSDPAGCGKGAGRLHMRLSYRSFESFKPQDTAECPEGIVAVKIMEVNGVPRRSKANMYLFAEVKCQGTSQLSTVVSAASEKPFVFSYRSSFEFYHTPDTAIVTINVYEKSNSGPDLLGSLETSVADISTARDKAPWTAEKQCGLMFLNHKRLDDIELVTIKCTMRFVPCP
ncbi:hypothetical protein FOA52_003660 [Chlamydomonas sp. UWO 241]|nr:hypothetical protein FOA52_003660 [Chlamydomonas sp. UWO 241]